MVPLKPEECLEGFAQEVLKPRDLYVLTSRVLCTFQFIISEKKLTGDYFLSLSINLVQLKFLQLTIAVQIYSLGNEYRVWY